MKPSAIRPSSAAHGSGRAIWWRYTTKVLPTFPQQPPPERADCASSSLVYLTLKGTELLDAACLLLAQFCHSATQGRKLAAPAQRTRVDKGSAQQDCVVFEAGAHTDVIQLSYHDCEWLAKPQSKTLLSQYVGWLLVKSETLGWNRALPDFGSGTSLRFSLRRRT